MKPTNEWYVQYFSLAHVGHESTPSAIPFDYEGNTNEFLQNNKYKIFNNHAKLSYSRFNHAQSSSEVHNNRPLLMIITSLGH